jgi:sugar fermentation stimulation protein A
MTLRLFNRLVKGVFLARINRFTVLCNVNGIETFAHLPNPGRLWELLIPGVEMYLEKQEQGARKTAYTAVAVMKEGRPIIIHTHKTNDIAAFLIDSGAIAQLRGARIIKKEVVHGHSRFDFLLNRQGQDIILEVKSCTLYSRHVAAFPDAVTARGTRHIHELACLANDNTLAAVLFVIQWPYARFFTPEYHTDLAFAQTLLAYKDKLMILPVVVEIDDSLAVAPRASTLPIHWDTIAKESEDRGAYLVVLKLDSYQTVEVGKLGLRAFRKGYYVYVGSAIKNLNARINRCRRLEKNRFWHIDYFREITEFQAALPIRSATSYECQIAERLSALADWQIPRFGSSDCRCSSHLFAFHDNPLQSRPFIAMVQDYRMDRLVSDLDNAS